MKRIRHTKQLNKWGYAFAALMIFGEGIMLHFRNIFMIYFYDIMMMHLEIFGEITMVHLGIFIF